MQDKDYTITSVQERDAWRSSYGSDMRSFAIQLEGIEGWLELSQRETTLAPLVGNTIHGHTETTQRGSNTYLKFKKVNEAFKNAPQQSNATPSEIVGTAKTLDYVVEMLEDLTGRRKKADVVLTADDFVEGGEKFNLEDIPFNQER